MAKVHFFVEIDLPQRTDKDLVKDYVKDAIVNWSGGMEPEHPLFNLQQRDVKVTHHTENYVAKRSATQTEYTTDQGEPLVRGMPGHPDNDMGM